MVCGLGMIFTRPFFDISLSAGLFYSILAILFLTFITGAVSPKYLGVTLCDIVISLVGFGIFMYQAAVNFYTFFDAYFLSHLILSLLFLLAFYWSLKNLRWLWHETRELVERASKKVEIEPEAREEEAKKKEMEKLKETEGAERAKPVIKDIIVISPSEPAASKAPEVLASAAGTAGVGVGVTTNRNIEPIEAATIIATPGSTVSEEATENPIPQTTKPPLTEEERRKSRYLSSET